VRQTILKLSTFRDTGDHEAQDEMTLIRLITVIIRLRLVDSKGVSRLGALEKGWKGKEKKMRNERKARSADITISC